MDGLNESKYNEIRKFLRCNNTREITDANIDQIQDATVQITGASRTFFNFGDVIVQTAAAIPRVTFEAVPNPDHVARILRELRIEEEVEKIEGRVR